VSKAVQINIKNIQKYTMIQVHMMGRT